MLLARKRVMRPTKTGTTVVVCVVAVFIMVGWPVRSSAGPIPLDHNQLSEKASEKARLTANKRTLRNFDRRVKAYCRVRDRIAKRLPHVSKESTPEQIEAHKKAFEDAVRKARGNLKPGYIFSKDIANYISSTIKAEFKGTDRKELRETVLEADTKGVPLRVNYPYPEAKELTEMPPTLLLKLPPLPKHVKYRFVRKHVLLVDRENDLIVDYMLNALP
jgi:hypothetical protein